MTGPGWACQSCGGPADETAAPICGGCSPVQVVVKPIDEPPLPEIRLRPYDDDLPPAA